MVYKIFYDEPLLRKPTRFYLSCM